ncbi:hypothetical protein AT2G10602 [Arabidopsis thaliana]|uniref:Uncharacterized protein n=1 Tax=Arabidopsis thaliana TaxID=3702 RepID=Q3EC35_ARATH|nr:uncharacterized protein AT2G10602 [Arabidopsis thaliana]AEC06151.1 hypothetical protein AT2G10602 [Arabidopsis thaliana]|eukprot:NP_671818.1 hypothetical protein AT2G10602 [Arabidopsis thaliana]
MELRVSTQEEGKGGAGGCQISWGLKSAARRGEGVVMRPSGRWKTRGDAQVQVSMVQKEITWSLLNPLPYSPRGEALEQLLNQLFIAPEGNQRILLAHRGSNRAATRQFIHSPRGEPEEKQLFYCLRGEPEEAADNHSTLYSTFHSIKANGFYLTC